MIDVDFHFLIAKSITKVIGFSWCNTLNEGSAIAIFLRHIISNHFKEDSLP